MGPTLKESAKKESLGWQYKELTFDFEEHKQISMFENEVRSVVEDNKAQRHIRGGQSTKQHYMKA